MANLHVVWDPKKVIELPPKGWLKRCEVSAAILPCADNLEDIDIYHVAKKLAEMLLEQISKEQQT